VLVSVLRGWTSKIIRGKKMKQHNNLEFHRRLRRPFSSVLSPIIESNFFLTAKGKLVDTYELHSFGVGVLIGLLTKFIPRELTVPYWGIILTVTTIALGIDSLREKPSDGKVKKKMREKLNLKGQIQKEGQYFILGLVSGVITAQGLF